MIFKSVFLLPCSRPINHRWRKLVGYCISVTKTPRTARKRIVMPTNHTPPETGPHRFRMGPWISCAPFEKLLHMEIVEAAAGRAILRMPFLVDLAQGAGLMHGGALVGLADTAVVMAIKSIVAPQTHFATVKMQANFRRPVRQGVVTARARVNAVRERWLEGRALVCDQEERTVLAFEATFKIARDTRIRITP